MFHENGSPRSLYIMILLTGFIDMLKGSSGPFGRRSIWVICMLPKILQLTVGSFDLAQVEKKSLLLRLTVH